MLTLNTWRTRQSLFASLSNVNQMFYFLDVSTWPIEITSANPWKIEKFINLHQPNFYFFVKFNQFIKSYGIRETN